MERKSSEQRSLARNLARTTFIAVAVAVLVVALFALAGVYGLARAQIDARHEAYRRIAAGEITERLKGAQDVLNTVAESITERGVDPNAVSRQFAASTGYFDRLLLTRPDGLVLVGQPLFQAASDVSTQPFFRAGRGRSSPVFTYVPPESATSAGTVWLSRSVTTGSQETFVVLARMRTAFVQVSVDQISSPDRVAMVIDGRGAIVASGRRGPTLDVGRAVFRSGGTNGAEGAVIIPVSPEGALTGQWARVPDAPGLDWRVLVAEPRLVVLADTWRALLPAGLAAGVFGVLAVGVAWLGARRLVAPVKEIGERAEKASHGAYVRPIAIQRSDEVGSLAEAFNSLALRLNALHDVSQLLASASEPEQVLDHVVTALDRIVHTDSVAVYIMDRSRSRVVLAKAEGAAAVALPKTISTATTSWLTDVLGAKGPSCFLGKLTGQPTTSGPGHRAKTYTVAVPLSAGIEQVGAAILTRENRQYVDAELEMLRTFAAQAAVALQTSRLFEVEQMSRREAEVLRAVAEQLVDPRDLGRALHDAGMMAIELLGASRGGVALSQPGDLGVEQDASDDVWLELWHALERTGTERLEPVLVPRAGRRSELASLLAGEEDAVLLLAPVTVGSTVRGVLGFEFDTRCESPSSHHVALASTVAKQLALAFDNAYLFRQVGERAANLETIFRITQAVSSSLQIGVVLNRVLDVVQKIFSADAVSLMTFEEKRRVMSTAMARGVVSAEILHLEREPGDDIPGYVFEERQPMLLRRLAGETWPLARLAATQGLRSLVSVPLLARGRSIGVLTIFSTDEAAFGEEDVELLRTFAAQASLAIDTADLYGKEHTVASVLQSSIMPDRLPEIEGLESSSVYIAAGKEGDIGGDYFDLFRAPDGRIVLAMGDVCGKGVVAATKTSMIRYTVRALVAAGMSAARCMSEVNRTVTETGETGDIVTLWLGYLDADAGTLTYANGGHPPALLLHAEDGHVDRLEPTGPLLGALASVVYEEETVRVGGGDLVLLYTDGVSEARKGNRFFGEGRVRRALEAGGSAIAVTQRLIAEVNHFTSGGLRDDVAILAVRLDGRRRRAAGETRSGKHPARVRKESPVKR